MKKRENGKVKKENKESEKWEGMKKKKWKEREGM